MYTENVRNLRVFWGVSNQVKSKLLKEGRLLFILVGVNKQEEDEAKANLFAFDNNILTDKKRGGEKR